jgi:type I restriction enzyme M protein
VKRFAEKVAFVWSIAELLRGDFKQSEYGKVILPFVVLRRLDCVLEPTKERVLAEAARTKVKNPELILQKAAGQPFYNTSKLDFRKLLADPDRIARNVQSYIRAFSPSAQDILENFDFDEQISRLDRANLLYKIVGSFADLDLHPSVVSNLEMGYIFEELIRRFSEQSNETAGEHFTPREVIRLMVNLLFAADRDFLTKPGVVRTLYDPACGTGGMLSVAEEYLREINDKARLVVFGQELNPESYAICKSDMMIKGQDPSRIHKGNSFTEDGEPSAKFDYMLSNPPFGVDWKKVQAVIEKEHKQRGPDGRFGAGLPRINDGSLLFLQHMISKMKPAKDGGSRIAIVFNASPLFTGGPGSGESEIRRWIIENDWLEAIVALPEELFYNTGIHTYVWVVTNRKEPRRKGKVQLIDGRALSRKMPKSLGNKRNQLGQDDIDAITRLYSDFSETDRSKVFENDFFGYRRVAIERPLRVRYEVTAEGVEVFRARLAENGNGRAPRSKARRAQSDGTGTDDVVGRVEQLVGTSTTDRASFERQIFDGTKVSPRVRRLVLEAFAVRDQSAPIAAHGGHRPEPDRDLRLYEDVPMGEDIESYFTTRVLPHAPDAWISSEAVKVGFEIPFTRLFYRYKPPRPLSEISAEIRALEKRVVSLLSEAT